MSVNNFRARIDINSIWEYTPPSDPPQWRIGGKIVDPTGSYKPADVTVGCRIVQRGYTTGGKVVYDRFVVKSIESYTAKSIILIVESDGDDGVMNNNGMPLSGSFPIGSEMWFSKSILKPSHHLNQFDPDYETGIDNLNLDELQHVGRIPMKQFLGLTEDATFPDIMEQWSQLKSVIIINSGETNPRLSLGTTLGGSEILYNFAINPASVNAGITTLGFTDIFSVLNTTTLYLSVGGTDDTWNGSTLDVYFIIEKLQ